MAIHAIASAKEKEENLILNAIQIQRNDALNQSLQAMLHQELDWDYVIAIADIHRVITLIHELLNQLQFSSDMPTMAWQQLRHKALTQISQTMMLNEELKTLVPLFQQNGIEMIVLKGPVLADSVYPKPELRSYADLDILVRFEQLQQVKSLMISQGYKLYEDIYPESFYLKYHHHLVFNKWAGSMPCMVEIHWHIFPPVIPIQVAADSLWSSSVPIKLDWIPETIYRLSWEDTLLHLSSTMILDDRISLRLFCDLAFILQKHQHEIGWQNLVYVSKIWLCFKPLYCALWSSSEYCGITLPEPVRRSFPFNSRQQLWLSQHLEDNIFYLTQQHMATSGGWQRSKLYLTYWYRNLVLADKGAYRRHIFHQILFPDEYFLRSFYQVKEETAPRSFSNRLRFFFKGVKNIIELTWMFIRSFHAKGK